MRHTNTDEGRGIGPGRIIGMGIVALVLALVLIGWWSGLFALIGDQVVAWWHAVTAWIADGHLLAVLGPAALAVVGVIALVLIIGDS